MRVGQKVRALFDFVFSGLPYLKTSQQFLASFSEPGGGEPGGVLSEMENAFWVPKVLRVPYPFEFNRKIYTGPLASRSGRYGGLEIVNMLTHFGVAGVVFVSLGVPNAVVLGPNDFVSSEVAKVHSAIYERGQFKDGATSFFGSRTIQISTRYHFIRSILSIDPGDKLANLYAQLSL